GAAMERDLDMRKRLEARAEARLRLPDALRDGADAAVRERVEVEDAIRLAEPERAQDDGLGLVRTPGHARSSLERPEAGTNPCPCPLKPRMSRIQMYTTRWCGYCVRAKAL